ncbi:MAG: hypothetical protein R6T87_05700 [Marinobacter sp.]
MAFLFTSPIINEVAVIMLSTVAASFPEFIMLKQVMTYRLLIMIFVILLANFMVVGWAINMISPWLFSGF